MFQQAVSMHKRVYAFLPPFVRLCPTFFAVVLAALLIGIFRLTSSKRCSASAPLGPPPHGSCATLTEVVKPCVPPWGIIPLLENIFAGVPLGQSEVIATDQGEPVTPVHVTAIASESPNGIIFFPAQVVPDCKREMDTPFSVMNGTIVEEMLQLNVN
jgi:hypothetical protein